MKRLPAALTAAILTLCFACGTANAQYLVGRWALGIDAGANYWITDYNEYKVGFGGQVVARYEIARYFGLGLAAGYEVLQTNQSTPLNPGAYASWIKMNAIPISLNAYFHFYPAKKVNPYFFVGAGLFMYQRYGIGTAPPVDGAWHSTYMIPLGFGVESFINKDVSIDASIGFTYTPDDVDARTSGAINGYAIARVGVNFYLNEGPPHKPAPKPAPARF